jgi:hypothetical protein
MNYCFTNVKKLVYFKLAYSDEFMKFNLKPTCFIFGKIVNRNISADTEKLSMLNLIIQLYNNFLNSKLNDKQWNCLKYSRFTILLIYKQEIKKCLLKIRIKHLFSCKKHNHSVLFYENDF